MGATLDPGLVTDVFRGDMLPLWDDGTKVRCRVERLGALQSPSGRIMAADPLAFLEIAPFERAAPAGEWPVSVALAQIGPDHERVAMARLDFAQTPAVEWRIAARPGQNPAELAEDEIFGYGVDAGLGCFVDETIITEWRRREDAGEWPALFHSDEFRSRFLSTKPNNYKSIDYALMPVSSRPPWNMAIFRSGWGDGFYASYWGFDRHGALTALVTDFALFAD